MNSIEQRFFGGQVIRAIRSYTLRGQETCCAPDVKSAKGLCPEIYISNEKKYWAAF